MNGAQVSFFFGVAYGQLLSGVAGSSGGGDEPNHPWRPKSVHEADAVPRRTKPASRRNDHGEGPFPCPVCARPFASEKAVHGHMRCHPERAWRGMEAPRQPPPAPAAADGRHYRYACDRCGAPFQTRQALGGHRASHNGRRGCFRLARQPAAVAPQPVPVPAFAFDLNEPLPELEEEE